MRVTEHVHSLWLNFEIPMPGGHRITRFVTAYVVEAERLTLIDTGVAANVPEIFACVESLGRRPEEIACVVNTHCHFDHVGGNGVVAERAPGVRFYAHPVDKPLIEDLDLQYRLRPAPVRDACSGPVRVTDALEEGGSVDLGGGFAIRAFHTPGHSPGSLSLLVEPDGALICGDVLPEPGTLPIYESVADTLASLEKLRARKDAKVLLSAMSREVSRGEEVRRHIDAGEAYVRRIGDLVREAVRERGGGIAPEEAARFVFSRLGLPEASIISIVVRTFAAHLEALG